MEEKILEQREGGEHARTGGMRGNIREKEEWRMNFMNSVNEWEPSKTGLGGVGRHQL